MKSHNNSILKYLKPRTDLVSYSTSIIKLFLSLGVATACIFRPSVSSEKLNTVVSIFCAIICIPVVFLFAGSIVEFVSTFYNRKHNRKDPRTITVYKNVDIDSVICGVKQNAIIDYEILWYNRIIHCGSSSDCAPENSDFFDKKYFIDSVLYDDIDSFRKALSSYMVNDSIQVITIDGLEQK